MILLHKLLCNESNLHEDMFHFYRDCTSNIQPNWKSQSNPTKSEVENFNY